MLTIDQLKKEYPDKQKAFSRNILREYLQYKILEIIFDSSLSSKLSFLGGTCLRIVYGNTRFSEDLDFDNFGMAESDFIDLSQQIKSELELEGYETEIVNIAKGAYRCKIKFPKLLFENDLSDLQEEKIMIQVDTAAHKFDYTPDKKILNKFEIFTEIFSTPIDILLAQKFYASLNRKRAKGRDFFDIVFLLPKTLPNLEYLKLKMNISNYRELKEKIIEGTKNFDFKKLSQDVEPFLFDSKDAKRVSLFLEYIKEFKF